MKPLISIVILVASSAIAAGPGGTDNPTFTSVVVNGAPSWFPGSGCITLAGGAQLCGDNKAGAILTNGSDGGVSPISAAQYIYGPANAPLSVAQVGDFDSLVAKSVADREFQIVCSSAGGAGLGTLGSGAPSTGSQFNDAIDANPRNISSSGIYAARAGLPPGVTSIVWNVNLQAGAGQTGNTLIGFMNASFGGDGCNAPTTYSLITPTSTMTNYTQSIAVTPPGLVFPGIVFNQSVWNTSATGGHPIIGTVQAKPVGGSGIFAADFFRIGAAANTLWYNARDENFYYDYEFRESPGAEMVLDTDATSMAVETEDDDTGTPSAQMSVVVLVNGRAYRTITAGGSGGAYYSQFFNVTLPPGMKRVEIVSGAAGDTQAGFLNNNNRRGHYLQAAYLPAAATSYVVPPPASTGRTLVIYGDSIGMGFYATYPLEQGWFQHLRHWFAGAVDLEDWSGRSVYFDLEANSPSDAGVDYYIPSLQSIVNHIAAVHPTDIWCQLGVNDYLNANWTAVNFGTAYAATLDALHARLPSAQIYVQTLTNTQEESTANAQGDLPSAFRTQQTNACNARSWCILVDGTTMFPSSCLIDGVHPAGDCEIGYARAVLSILEAQ